MSNFLAIATVTATLQSVIQNAVDAPDVNVSGAKATAVRPDGATSGTPTTGVNIFLYQVMPNGALRNADLPNRDVGGAFVRRPRAALDLHYLLSFYGDEGMLEPQRLLGVVTHTLNSQPTLTRDMIRDMLNDAAFAFLAGSDLAEENEVVRFIPLGLSLEELSKLWSVFFQTTYVLSIAYQASVVLIEGAERPRAALPVRERTITVLPFRLPVIEKVFSDLGENLPILTGSTLIVRGRQLRDVTLLLISGSELTPQPQDVSDKEIRVALPANLRAGINSVQVVQKLMLGVPPAEHRGFESNVAALVLAPKIKGITASASSFTIDVEPQLQVSQRVVLLLNNVTTGASYSFSIAPLVANTGQVTFPVSGLDSGQYFVRVQVDGAESSLLNLDPNSPNFKELIAPQVTI
jgi:hypothetical protein